MEIKIRISPAGDGAALVAFLKPADIEAAAAAALALEAALARDPTPALLEATPGLRTLLARYDPLRASFANVAAALRARVSAIDAPGAEVEPSRRWRLPVAYGGAAGADLAEVAAETGLSQEAVVSLHAEAAHRVLMLGFLPGAPYLGGLPSVLSAPRRSEPRLRVPEGAVAIAAGLTVIYPVESPGGWRLLGRTPTRLFEAGALEPALLAPGDAVRFEPVSAEEVAQLAARAAEGDWRPAVETQGAP